MKKTQDVFFKEEEVGTLPSGTAEYFGTAITALRRDRIAFAALIQNEYGELSHAVALPPLNGVSKLTFENLPSLEGVQPIRPEDFFRAAQSSSYEIKALNWLLKASRYLTKSVLFSFLDPDGSASIGFGTPATFTVGKSQEHELQKRIDETYSLIELRSAQTAGEFNAALEAFALANTGLTTTLKRLDWLMQRHLNGDATLDEADFAEQVAGLQIKLIGFNADAITSVQAWQFAKSKLDRMLLNGYYHDLEVAIPEENKKI